MCINDMCIGNEMIFTLNHSYDLELCHYFCYLILGIDLFNEYRLNTDLHFTNLWFDLFIVIYGKYVIMYPDSIMKPQYFIVHSKVTA